MKWKTKDGRKISVSELSNQHLSNIVKMIERKNYWHSEKALDCLGYACSGNHGEMAMDAAMEAFNSSKFSSLTDAIFDEASKRGI